MTCAFFSLYVIRSQKVYLRMVLLSYNSGERHYCNPSIKRKMNETVRFPRLGNACLEASEKLTHKEVGCM